MAAEAESPPVVAVMDSGVGGLPYLESARRLLPGVAFVYLADRAGFPYGTKPREEVEAIVRDRVGRLVRAWSPSALVIACNTASQAALAAVRSDHPGLPVVGTVPAIKPAAAESSTRTIGVLATEASVRDPYLDGLEDEFARGVTVVRRPAQDLVAFVERRLFDAGPEETRRVLRPHLDFLVERGVDRIVLACTHFLHVAGAIEALARELSAARGGPPVLVVDSRDGVARRLAGLLAKRGSAGGLGRGSSPRSRLLLSGEAPFEGVYAEFASRFDLDGPFPLDGGRP